MSNFSRDSGRGRSPNSQAGNVSQPKAIRWIGAGLQLLAVALCLETLLGISDGLALPLRLFLLGLIGTCIILRLGWLTLVALQMSLLVIEQRQGEVSQYPLAFFYALASTAMIVAAMKVPETHRFVTSFFASEKVTSKHQFGFVIVRLAISLLQLTLMVSVAGFLLSRVPIGLQAESWLEWSRQNGQAVWPGALLVVLVIAVLVWVRENAWRQLVPSQASLYLRSVQLIANYRDLFGFERHRLNRLRRAQKMGLAETSRPANPPKLRRSGRNDKTNDKTNDKGLK